MAYEFTKLSDVAVAETPADNSHVLIEEDGVIKKAPKTAVGGGGEPTTVIKISTDYWDDMTSDSVSFEKGDYATLCTDGVANPASVRIVHEVPSGATRIGGSASPMERSAVGTSIPTNIQLSIDRDVLIITFMAMSFLNGCLYNVALIFSHSTGVFQEYFSIELTHDK